MTNGTFDVIVVGGGHAGAEAAHAASRLGARTLLVTMSLDKLGAMSCNPAIGGIGKGHMVREIDALGGLMGRAADATAIQFRMLNRSKGPAVWGPRCQSDRVLYAGAVRRALEGGALRRSAGMREGNVGGMQSGMPNLYFRQDMVVDLLTEVGDHGPRVTGVVTQTGQEIRAPRVIVTSGTFLNGIIHIGEQQFGGGRSGERAAVGLSATLERLGFELDRLKTGTPPRVDGRSIDYAACDEQAGDDAPRPFSFVADSLPAEQRSCWLTHTDSQVHDVLRTGFERSPMFAGRIEGKGPRYCPSIEDKIERFADKDSHQLFLEPEGWDTYEVYVNGFSTSLPEEVQAEAIRKVPGLEEAHILRPGYAIEYDYAPPYQLHYSLETKRVAGLFFAGQLNGTTGYEEAASQGLMAGLNAVRTLGGEGPVTLGRDQAYIGVLIDDLIAKGTDEPYRMFTSRAEHRLLLRQDNADERLTPLGRELGLVDAERFDRFERTRDAIQQTRESLEATTAKPEEVNGYLESMGSSPIDEGQRFARLAVRPEVVLEDLLEASGRQDLVTKAPGLESSVERVETALKYAGYLDREHERVDRMRRLEAKRFPSGFDFAGVRAISSEAREKLEKIQPETLGQAGRISGVSPADVQALLVLLKKPGGDGAVIEARPA